MNAKTTIDLVTGGSGYFGSLLVRRLIDSGRRVRVFDLHEADDHPAGVEFVAGDIRDPEACRRACQGVSTAYHCVAQVPLAKDSELFWSVNRDGTQNILEASLKASLDKFVYLSSSAVFGIPKVHPITAQTPPSPSEDYGAAKLAGEELCREYAGKGLDVSIVRPRTILGHGRLGIMQIVFEWVYQSRNVFVLGRGDNRYQFVHADDLAEACLLAARKPGYAAYNIGADEFGTMRETLEGLVEHAGTGSKVRSLPYGPAVAAMKLTTRLGISPLAAYHWMVYGQDVYFDTSYTRDELGWRPKFGNVAMFAQSYDWYVENRSKILAAKGNSPHRSAVKQGALALLRWI